MEQGNIIPEKSAAVTDFKIAMSRDPNWQCINPAPGDQSSVERLKPPLARPVISQPSDQSSVASSCTGLSDGEIQCRNMPDELYWAAAKDDVDNFEGVLKKISTEKNLGSSDILELTSPSGNTLLHVAVMNNCHEIVKLLLRDYSLSLTFKQNLAGDTPLHFALRGRNDLVETLMVFIESKSSPDSQVVVNSGIPEMGNFARIKNRKGNTVLHEAVLHDNFSERLEGFIRKDHEACLLPNNQGKSSLFLAAEFGKEDSFRKMLDILEKGNVIEKRRQGRSPLLPIVQNKNKDLMDIILSYEPAFISLLDEDGMTPLHHAASTGYIDMVKKIVDKKVEYASVRDKIGFLPIHTAAAHGQKIVIEHLFRPSLGPSELLTDTGQNIFHIAAAKGKSNVVCYVLENSSLEYLINEADENGDTPLHLATVNLHAKVVLTMTRDRKVELGCVNLCGFTPLDEAEYGMDSLPSFDKRLTWLALKAARAPHSPVEKNLEVHLSHLSKSRVSKSASTVDCKDRVNVLLVVATLVATVSFAAGFTMPGGNNSSDPNQGMATMLRNKVFSVFIFSDTVAMYTSTLVSTILIWTQLSNIHIALRVAVPLLGASLGMMSLAFIAGVYLAVSHLHWLAYTVLITGLIFFIAFHLVFFLLFIPNSSGCRFWHFLGYCLFKLLIHMTSRNCDMTSD